MSNTSPKISEAMLKPTVATRNGSGSAILYRDASRIGAIDSKNASVDIAASGHQPSHAAQIAASASATQIGAISRMRVLLCSDACVILLSLSSARGVPISWG